ncbi:STAS domain-containing protein [Pseudonocardia endophytica]|uniref:STAS domain-containing protein n=1 Tax=Pseudonocardia endophytica TaxID=401976 RepID=UPI0014047CF3|nr:STAS domain-containing protein [Pseudonocardia endophytica]
MITLLGSASTQPDGAGELSASLSTPRTGLSVLSVTGEIDTLTAPQLSTALDELLAVPDGDLAIDLDGVTFLASSGLGVLIHAARNAARGNRMLYVVVSNRAVLRPLEVTGSSQLFTIIPAVDDVPDPASASEIT